MPRFLVRLFAAFGVVAFLSLILILVATDPIAYVFKNRPLDTLETALRIRNPHLAYRIFGKLEGDDDVDYITFTVQRDTPISASLQTPLSDRAFNPSLILFGPGLKMPEQEPPVSVGVNGAVVVHPDADVRAVAFDSSILRSMYSGPNIDVIAPQDGTYAIAILDPEGRAGRYALSVGRVRQRGFERWFSYMTGTLRAIARIY